MRQSPGAGAVTQAERIIDSVSTTRRSVAPVEVCGSGGGVWLRRRCVALVEFLLQENVRVECFWY